MHDLMRVPPAVAHQRPSRANTTSTQWPPRTCCSICATRWAARALPDASTIVIERVRDELGDWRVRAVAARRTRACALGDGGSGASAKKPVSTSKRSGATTGS